MKSKLFCISAIILLLGVVACSADSLAELCPAEPVAVQQETPAAFSAITRENAHQVTRLQCIETSTTGAIAIASNGSMLAVASPGKIRIYDLPNLTLLQDLRQHTGIVRDLSWHPDSNLLASGGQDGSIVIWDMVDGQAQHILREHTDEVRALAWSLDGTRLASVGWDYMLRVWNVAEERHQEVNTGSVASIVWLNDDLLASGASVGHVSIWNANTLQELKILQGYVPPNTRSVAWTPDVVDLAWLPMKSELVLTRLDGFVSVWDMCEPQHLRDLPTYNTQSVYRLAFSPDGELLAGINFGGSILLWNPHTGELLYVIEESDVFYPDIAWTPDGTRLITSGEGNQLCVWGISSQ